RDVAARRLVNLGTLDLAALDRKLQGVAGLALACGAAELRLDQETGLLHGILGGDGIDSDRAVIAKMVTAALTFRAGGLLALGEALVRILGIDVRVRTDAYRVVVGVGDSDAGAAAGRPRQGGCGQGQQQE